MLIYIYVNICQLREKAYLFMFAAVQKSYSQGTVRWNRKTNFGARNRVCSGFVHFLAV